MTPTKAELEKINAEQAQQIQDQGAQIAEMQEQMMVLMAEMSKPEEKERLPDKDGGGWLIETPNQEYSGPTAHVRFMNGRAVVAANEQDAGIKLHRLQNDFGYKVTVLSEDKFKQVMYEIATGTPLHAEQSAAEKLVLPQVV